jgi:hypothetical protein
MKSNVHEVFDRAHFPTIALEEAVSPNDVSPLPVFPGQQLVHIGAASGSAVGVA